jgi:hypothetical protein
LDRGLEGDPDGVPGGQGGRLQGHPLLVLIQKCPAAQVEVLWAGVDQGDGFPFWGGPEGVDQGRDDAREVIWFARSGGGSGAGVGGPEMVCPV